MCCERNIIAKWKNVFGPITAKAAPEVSLKAQAYCLKDKTELSLKSFQGNRIMCVGLWSDVQKIVHCFFYEIVKDHRYPFNFTQLLGRRLFNGNNNVILARWTKCSFNYSVWLRLNEIVLSGSFKKKKEVTHEPFCATIMHWYVFVYAPEDSIGPLASSQSLRAMPLSSVKVWKSQSLLWPFLLGHQDNQQVLTSAFY